MRLVLVKFPSCSRPFLYNSSEVLCEGDDVICATSMGKQEGTVIATLITSKGSDEAYFINLMNQCKEVKPILGKIDFFPVEELEVIGGEECS